MGKGFVFFSAGRRRSYHKDNGAMRGDGCSLLPAGISRQPDDFPRHRQNVTCILSGKKGR